MSYKPSSLYNLIQAINNGLFLPHIQRPFVWEEEQMRKLFDSLMRNYPTELQKGHLEQTRLRFLLLNLVYVDQMGTSPFDVKYKGNEPHVDHIYPRHALSTKLGLGSAEVNTLGNYRFVGATDNIRKRAELPDSYFGRLKSFGSPIEKHLLLDEFAADTKKLVFDVPTYRSFRDKRLHRIWEIYRRTVNPELAAAIMAGGAP